MDKQKDFEKGWEENKAKKKKAVEEMVKDIFDYATTLVNLETATEYMALVKRYEETLKGYSKHLINAGYRKITEDSVVLTRKEYKKLKHGSGTLEQFYNQYPYRVLVGFNSIVFSQDRESYEKLYNEIEEKASKETAEKFAERLKSMAYQSTDWSHGEHPMVVEVDYIDEICEEITGDKV